MIRSDFPEMRPYELQQTSHQARSPSMEEVLATTEHNYKEYPYVVSTVVNSPTIPIQQYPQLIQQEFQSFQPINPPYASDREIENYRISAPKTKEDYVLFPRNPTAESREEISENAQISNIGELPQQEYYQVDPTTQPRYYSVNPPTQPSLSYSNTIQNNRTSTTTSADEYYQSPWQVEQRPSAFAAKAPRRVKTRLLHFEAFTELFDQ